MKTFLCALFLLLSMSSLSPVKAADTIHFLVAELPDRKNHNDSYVLPLSKQEDIDHARYLVSKYKLGYSSGDRTIVVANVGAAKDDINRNFLDPKFPKWSWQVSQFVNSRMHHSKSGTAIPPGWRRPIGRMGAR